MDFEVYNETIEVYLTWPEAIKYCKQLGEGWRLPTKEELDVMYKLHVKGTLKFGNYGCWGEAKSETTAWSKGFNTGNIYENPTTNINYIRPVRNTVDKSYWASDLPLPLSPSKDDVEVYRQYLKQGTTLLLGCTRQLIELSDEQMDIDPWYTASTVIVQDWTQNTKHYTNIIGDGVFSILTKERSNEVLKMCSKHCATFILRSFNKKLPIMRIAAHFPTVEDFSIKPSIVQPYKDYTFYVWHF